MQSGRVMVCVPGSGSYLLVRVNHDCSEHLSVSRTEGVSAEKSVQKPPARLLQLAVYPQRLPALVACHVAMHRFRTTSQRLRLRLGQLPQSARDRRPKWETRKVVRGAVGSNATSRRRISEATNCKVRSPASSPRRHIDVCPPSDVSLRGLLVHQHGHVAKPVLIAFRDGVAAGSAARAIAADASSLGALRDAQTR